jgi:hypothetical protein
MTTNQLISQFHTAALLCDVAVGFVSIYYLIGKLTLKSNCRYSLPETKKKPTQLHYIEVPFVLRYRF